MSFEDWDTLARVLTGKRTELLRYVRHNDARSIRQLAAALGRDYSNVHANVKALAAEGLLDLDDGRVRADFHAIEATLAL